MAVAALAVSILAVFATVLYGHRSATSADRSADSSERSARAAQEAAAEAKRPKFSASSKRGSGGTTIYVDLRCDHAVTPLRKVRVGLLEDSPFAFLQASSPTPDRPTESAEFEEQIEVGTVMRLICTTRLANAVGAEDHLMVQSWALDGDSRWRDLVPVRLPRAQEGARSP